MLCEEYNCEIEKVIIESGVNNLKTIVHFEGCIIQYEPKTHLFTAFVRNPRTMKFIDKELRATTKDRIILDTLMAMWIEWFKDTNSGQNSVKNDQ